MAAQSPDGRRGPADRRRDGPASRYWAWCSRRTGPGPVRAGGLGDGSRGRAGDDQVAVRSLTTLPISWAGVTPSAALDQRLLLRPACALNLWYRVHRSIGLGLYLYEGDRMLRVPRSALAISSYATLAKYCHFLCAPADTHAPHKRPPRAANQVPGS